MRTRVLFALALLLSIVTSAGAQTVAADRFRFNTGPCTLSTGSGSPEGVVTGKVCDRYTSYGDGTVWIKASGTGNTGWTPLPRVDQGNVFLQKQEIDVNAETLKTYPVTGTSATYHRQSNTGDVLLYGLESSAGGTIFTGTNAYAAVFGVQGAHDLAFATNNTMRLQIDSSGNLLPYVTSAYNLGSSTRWWNHAYFAQIDAVLFAKSTQTLYGGWLSVSKNAGTFAVAVASGDTTIDFGTAMVLNQFVLVRATDTGGTITEEYIKVGSLSAGTVYNVTRNLSGLGAKNWAKGTPFQVRGVAGDGWLELNAFDTPRMSVFTQGSTYNNSTENLRVGHLTGMPNSSSGIGIYVGDASNYLRYDSTALKLQSATVSIDGTKISVTPDSSSVYTDTHAYGFTVATGQLGTSGADVPGIVRAARLNSTWSGAGSMNTFVTLHTSGDAADTAAADLSVVSSPSTSEAYVNTNVGIRERSRTKALGEWTTPSYAQANFASSAGTTCSGNPCWEVDSGDVVTYAYTLVGNTMTVMFEIESSDVRSAPGSLYIMVPASKVAAKTTRAMVQIVDAAGSGTVGVARVSATGTIIEIQASAAGAGWTTTTSDNTSVRGQITFEIQ